MKIFVHNLTYKVYEPYIQGYPSSVFAASNGSFEKKIAPLMNISYRGIESASLSTQKKLNIFQG
jgi:hypothetical protein